MKKTDSVVGLWIVLLIVMMTSCVNESFEETTNLIDTDSQLFATLTEFTDKRSKNKETICLEFIYPFSIYSYDENQEASGNIIVNDNLEFIQLLSDMANETAIGLSYPIEAETVDGTTLEINNNAQLKAAIEACIETEILTYCDDTLGEFQCIWTIQSDDEYNESLFRFYPDGNGVFYHAGNAHRASWVSVYIEARLGVNIKLEGVSDEATDWNHHWDADIINDSEINISIEGKDYTISKTCNTTNDCQYVEFKECVIKDSITTFSLQNYDNCILSLQNLDATDYEISYYKTLENANNAVNNLSLTNYQPLKSPDFVYTRIQKKQDTTDIKTTRIVLLKATCNDEDTP